MTRLLEDEFRRDSGTNSLRDGLGLGPRPDDIRDREDEMGGRLKYNSLSLLPLQ